MQRFKKWSTVDRWIDLIVDIGFIAFDVLSSPILIIVRTIRISLTNMSINILNDFLNGLLTSGSKSNKLYIVM